MKNWTIFAAMVLIAWSCTSQEDTINRPVTIPYWQAQQIALDLAEKDRLEGLHALNLLRISNLNAQIETLENINADRIRQVNSLENSVNLLQRQLEAEKLKDPKSNWFIWTLGIIAGIGTGYIVGSLN